ncbi:MAG TPA: Nif3-like dinuclear metal center hexameric protein [Gemmatimonadaceae bacterium]|jgi:dinuclear metal center YbgI/SA1388 family protein|nr:Nif3-like dinuclear metal center hexameric protein [Gemmatimonadaceae bacterium]
MPALSELTDFLDTMLNIGGIPDYSGAMNGLQLANARAIDMIATAVDFSSETARGAVNGGAQLLLVHHGMFWGGAQPIVGHRYDRLRLLIENDVAVYSAHLPLDVHAGVGNNALLAKLFELDPTDGFARYQSIDVGLSGPANVPTRVLADRAAQLAAQYGGTINATPFAADRLTKRWGICSGAGADSSTLREAAQRRLDTLIVGEGPHHTAVEARELGIVVIYAGHYATETLGVRALGTAAADRFGISSTFIDAPSGL